ncbi:uncharacterized protein LOC130988247 isoform X2 [Salvia miltiorrhiza]|uniref:uncharacterized protein LOC130988247 isoform X2 n=1 Tax=Salvia miltiorrhiza TaxID=226208 RepID=UPI0025AD8308|nr:uncharacterized protein LOC130988247 isoform X2 [Salvia miltiorrhiza]XP_057768025.1 uncharacterized protein LOC130988247 isoform X2 [Salvia miltiorrhiza]
MDLKLFTLDIDELIHEFTQCESSAFAEFKRVWLSRKFSYIFEASPSTNQGFFMQSLYAHSISYMVSADSFSKRLGGLYCLYCLYETQLFKPPFKIYLYLELKKLKNLVIEAKAAGVKVVAALVKGMLERNMFLFGFVGVNEGSATERVNELTNDQNARIRSAYKLLFNNSRLEHFIHMDLDTELDVDLFKKRSSEYAAAKELAIKEASKVVDVENIKHIVENQRLIGDVVEKTAADWKSQKEALYRQTGFSPLSVAEASQQEEGEYSTGRNSKKRKEGCDDLATQEDGENLEDPEDFCRELEETLLFEPSECDEEDT